MARALRLDCAGAVHHITSRGNERRNIFRDDRDRRRFVHYLGQAVRRYRWTLTAWVLMSNHFHLVVETSESNLSEGMQWLNGSYACWFNKRHGRSGHLYGDRFHSFLVHKEAYLREVIRYVILNPVRAKMVARAEQYRWSSYRATAGLEAAPEWLAIEAITPYFGESESWRENYRSFVEEKVDSDERLWDKVQRQIYLGTDCWVASMRELVESKLRGDDHPRVQREVGRPEMNSIVTAVARSFKTTASVLPNGRGGAARMVAAWVGWYEGLHRLRSIAASLRLQSSGRVSDLVRECERELRRDHALRSRVDQTLATLTI